MLMRLEDFRSAGYVSVCSEKLKMSLVFGAN